MKQASISGKIEVLRVNDRGQISRNSEMMTNADVVVQLDSSPKSFGYDLTDKEGKLQARFGMLSVLTNAFMNKAEVDIVYEIEEGEKHGNLISVELRRY